ALHAQRAPCRPTALGSLQIVGERSKHRRPHTGLSGMSIKTSTPPHRGWLTGAALSAVHVLSWPGACAVIVSVFGILVYRLLAERARRKTLEATFRAAPPNTVVVQDGGPGRPAMRVRVRER